MEFVKLTSDTIKQQLLNLRQIVFEVTDSCNLKCKYCVMESSMAAMIKEKSKICRLKKQSC